MSAEGIRAEQEAILNFLAEYECIEALILLLNECQFYEEVTLRATYREGNQFESFADTDRSTEGLENLLSNTPHGRD